MGCVAATEIDGGAMQEGALRAALHSKVGAGGEAVGKASGRYNSGLR